MEPTGSSRSRGFIIKKRVYAICMVRKTQHALSCSLCFFLHSMDKTCAAAQSVQFTSTRGYLKVYALCSLRKTQHALHCGLCSLIVSNYRYVTFAVAQSAYPTSTHHDCLKVDAFCVLSKTQHVMRHSLLILFLTS